MRFNKIVKGIAVAIPMFTLAACGSTSTTDVDSQETNQIDGQTSQVEQGSNNTVQTGAVTKHMTPEERQRVVAAQKAEQQRQAEKELRKEHIVYFDFDTANVSGKFALILEAHANYLRDNPSVNVKIEGHADERGTPEYNIALGERRAKAVSKYLQGLGVNSKQIDTMSYGEEKPLDYSRTERGFSKNRRAVLVY
ncbi:peptidoglycan-associated lipoprotein Pal [Psychrobium sp. 1_MG-2023]|uniref:peptidoglycan-associated lipoprotein Pal n=1 Tax=Psychrobium sp. 1_MG-2023 TaxID=3062624 RepID=UPI000C31F042|nr:peptidoglycan-associated lipoprotein Pal [Psychrobium sp. 1_MG-2023]MDP2560255.1 peptidoglycan-associated lipoprotein Pal [Psychrobium sp. 1_MG-2023]PKF57063.1 peptidoglycan-associated lipoprotein [Alteromonadales bacterium alter-6D02]